MIYLRRSGSDLTVGSTDARHLQDVACRALERGEAVELQIDHAPWQQPTTPDEVREVLDELCDVLDARREQMLSDEPLPLEDLA